MYDTCVVCLINASNFCCSNKFVSIIIIVICKAELFRDLEIFGRKSLLTSRERIKSSWKKTSLLPKVVNTSISKLLLYTLFFLHLFLYQSCFQTTSPLRRHYFEASTTHEYNLGYIWLHLVTFGYIWLHSDTFGYLCMLILHIIFCGLNGTVLLQFQEFGNKIHSIKLNKSVGHDRNSTADLSNDDYLSQRNSLQRI